MENPYQIRQLLLHLQNILQVFHTLRLCHLNNPESTPCISLDYRFHENVLSNQLSIKLHHIIQFCSPDYFATDSEQNAPDNRGGTHSKMILLLGFLLLGILLYSCGMLCVTVSATSRLRYNLHCVVLDQKALSLKLILIFKPQCVQKFIKTNLSHLQCEVHAQRS